MPQPSGLLQVREESKVLTLCRFYSEQSSFVLISFTTYVSA